MRQAYVKRGYLPFTRIQKYREATAREEAFSYQRFDTFLTLKIKASFPLEISMKSKKGPIGKPMQ